MQIKEGSQYDVSVPSYIRIIPGTEGNLVVVANDQGNIVLLNLNNRTTELLTEHTGAFVGKRWNIVIMFSVSVASCDLYIIAHSEDGTMYPMLKT